MKRAAIAAVVLLAMLGGIGQILLGLHRSGTELCTHANDLIAAVRAEDRAESVRLFNELIVHWSQREPRLVPLIGRMHTDPVTVSLARAQMLLSRGESSDLLAELGEFIAIIERTWRS
ncbi:MAG: DUF4363 family protein, partial [Oscillospiraceae bacterium]